MYFIGATRRGGQENEDWLACTSGLVVVLDGATVRTATKCSHGPAWYARKLGAAIIGHAASMSQELAVILADSIRDVAALHETTCDLTHPASPSAAVGIIRVGGDSTQYLILGDVTVVAQVSGEVIAISDDRVSQTALDERREADRYPIGSEEKQAAMQRMKVIELAAKNTPGGYWISGSDPRVVEYAITGTWATAQLDKIAVLTDGAARYVDLFRQADWPSVLASLGSVGPVNLINAVRQLEQDDPEGRRYPRNKRSDDATAAYVELAEG